MTDCNYNIDLQKLVREGTSQEQRPFQALDPAYAPVSGQTPAHSMVFAQAYAAYLRFFDTGDVPVDDWQRFFNSDVSVRLAVAAVQDIDNYRVAVKQYFDFLNDIGHDTPVFDADCKTNLGWLFSGIGTLATRLDELKEALPPDIALKNTLQNLIQTQLAPGFRRLIGYYNGGLNLSLVDGNAVAQDIRIFGSPAFRFQSALSRDFSRDWITDGSADWATYLAGIAPDQGIFGNAASVFVRINRLATHNLFSSVFDQFLKAYARTASDAKKNLDSTFADRDNHEPHYALFLAFLRLFEYTRAEMNTLTGRHLDFYYRDILRLREKPAEPGRVHLLVELAKHATSHHLTPDVLFKAGKDALGKEVFFANDRDFVANSAKVAALKTLYRHIGESVADQHNGRLFASPVANSDDGLGAELLSADQSWHPFYNKVYDDGVLTQIRMPKAEIGFAVASHHLYLTEGYRRVAITTNFRQAVWAGNVQVLISYTTEKGWHTLTQQVAIGSTKKVKVGAAIFSQKVPATSAVFAFELDADTPPVLPYNPKVHGGDFRTPHPVVKVVLQHLDGQNFPFAALESAALKNYSIAVQVGLDADGDPAAQPGLKNLAVNTDFGLVDLSKPFLPFGPTPQKDASIVIGHKEAFQKPNAKLTLKITWKKTFVNPGATIRSLIKGAWDAPASNLNLNQSAFSYTLPAIISPAIDYSANEFYSAESTSGFLRLSINSDFGHKQWQDNLTKHLLEVVKGTKTPQDTLPQPPVVPEIEALSLCYAAGSGEIRLDLPGVQDASGAKFYHLAPFGIAERHPSLSAGAAIALFPQFRHTTDGLTVRHESEFYIGLSGLKPPQNLALLFQVAEGTADPLSKKPDPHLNWSFLRRNEWAPLEKDAVEDQTGQLTRSGIVTLAVPRDATDNDTLMPGGLHWIRVAVANESDTVCRVVLVAAQALRATFTDRDNDPAFTATPLGAGAIAKLDQPDAAVKKIEQPFASFGGRGKEAADAYYTRVSERLRHKDRAIALWDYERLVLEAFPQIYKVKCLNHTQYEPNEGGKGIYRELAAGHVTVVTIPNQQFQNLRDPLRPYTSLGLLLEIEAFLRERLSCFAKLHVKNPQFEELRLDFRVRFLPGFDETYYTAKLKQEITRYLSPWAYPGGGSPSFGGKIFKSVLINFVEERPYVDYVTDFQLFHDVGGKKGGADLEEVEGSTAVSILVSVPEEKHRIIPITTTGTPALAQAPGEDCSCKK